MHATQKLRTIVLLVFMGVCFLAIIVRLFDIQYIHRDVYQQRARKQFRYPLQIKVKRGKIYSRNMVEEEIRL